MPDHCSQADALQARFDAQAEELKEIIVRPKAGDVEVWFLGVGWVPYIEDAVGELRRA